MMNYPTNAWDTPNSMGGTKSNGDAFNVLQSAADNGDLTDSNDFNDLQLNNIADRRELKDTLDSSVDTSDAGKLTGADLYGGFADDVVYPTDLRPGTTEATGMSQSVDDLQMALNNLRTEIESLVGSDGNSGSLSTLNVNVTSNLGDEKNFVANALNLKVNMAVAKAMNLAFHLKRLNKQVTYISGGYTEGMINPATVVLPSGMFNGYNTP